MRSLLSRFRRPAGPPPADPDLVRRARRYFSEDELARATYEDGELRLFDAAFRADAEGDGLVAVTLPDNEYLRQQQEQLDAENLTWEVAAFLKVRRFSAPEEIVERARTGELYDESYFTRRGGGAPYVGYPREYTGYEGAAGQLADEFIAYYMPRTALDLGCATGLLVRELEQRDVAAAGIDVSEWAVQHAVSDAVVLGSALDLPYEDDRFDLVFSQDFMEHIHPDDLPAVLREQVRVTKPGGRILHLIPFYDSDPPVQMDAHLCQATQDWWRRLFETTEGLRIVREPDDDPSRLVNRYFELTPAG